MNSPQRKLLKKRAAEEASLVRADEDERDGARKRSFAALELKTVIRENHGGVTTTHVEFARGRGTRVSNLYATCGGRTATVYDDEHFGDHTAVVAQYVHETTEHQRGGMGCDFELARAFPVVVVRRPSTRAGERDARAAIRIARRDPRDLVTS